MADSILNRGDIIDAVAAQVDLPQTKVDAVLKSFESAIARQLSTGGEVRIAGFGSFKVAERAARTSRNPRTGEPIDVPARTAPRFIAGKGLKDAAGSVHGSKSDEKKAPAKTASTKAADAKTADAKAPKTEKAPKAAKSADKASTKGKKK